MRGGGKWDMQLAKATRARQTTSNPDMQHIGSGMKDQTPKRQDWKGRKEGRTFKRGWEGG